MGNRLGVDVSGSLVRVAVSLSDQKIVPVVHSEETIQVHEPGGAFEPIHASTESPLEDVILTFLKDAPVWGAPWLFDRPTRGQKGSNARVYCFLIDSRDTDPFLQIALHNLYKIRERLVPDVPNLKDEFPVNITGSGAAELIRWTEEKLLGFNEEKVAQGQLPLSITFQRVRELDCVLQSLDFLLKELPSMLFNYKRTHQGLTDAGPLPSTATFESVAMTEDDRENFYPYLLVNMKAGVSFHLVSSATESVRVGGSPIGFSTFVSLVKMLCGEDTTAFDAFLFAQRGDQSTVDMLVRDIYGGDYPAIGLKGSLVASTLGKMQNIHPIRTPLEAPCAKNKISGRPAITLQQPHLSGFGSRSGGGRIDDASNRSVHSESAFSDAAVTSNYTTVKGVRCHDVLGSEQYVPESAVDDCSSRDEDLKGALDNESLRSSEEEIPGKAPSEADLAKSLLSMTSFNVTQLAYFNAVLYKCNRITFCGYYLNLPTVLAKFQFCIDFWSAKSCKVHFVKVAPFLGCFGATLHRRRRSLSQNVRCGTVTSA